MGFSDKKHLLELFPEEDRQGMVFEYIRRNPSAILSLEKDPLLKVKGIDKEKTYAAALAAYWAQGDVLD